MSDPNAPRISRAALTGFILGLLALVLGALTGAAALLVSLRGLRSINSGENRLRGRRLAVAGMALGALGCVVTLLGLGAILVIHLTVRAQRVECANNLRRIGLAANTYTDAHQGTFPRGTLANPALPPHQRLSWLVDLLPYLDEEIGGERYRKMASEVDRDEGWAGPANAKPLDTPLPVFLCPAHPQFERRPHPGLTHYVGMTGVGPSAAVLPTDSPRAGMFGYERRVRRRDVTAGISFTMLATETARDNGPWLAGDRPTLREVSPDEERCLGPGRPFGGLHPDGANVLWVDGSVRWFNDNVNAADFRAQATLSGKPEGLP